MSNAEIAKHMLTKYEEETTCAWAYLDMAEAAEKMEESERTERLMKGLVEMAHDEYTHAEFIAMMMCEFGVELPAANAEKLEKLKNRLEPYFR